MSYELYITRAEHWLESESQPISLEEWQATIGNYPGLSAQDCVYARNPVSHEEIKVPLPHGARLDVNGGPLYFSFDRGRVSVGEFEELIPHVKEIAIALNAKLIGEEGEVY